MTGDRRVLIADDGPWLSGGDATAVRAGCGAETLARCGDRSANAA
jgi:hypothetical protein